MEMQTKIIEIKKCNKNQSCAQEYVYYNLLKTLTICNDISKRF